MKRKQIFTLAAILIVLGFCAYSWHDWYWYWYAGIHPDITRKYEQQFSDLSNRELLDILSERASPRTGGAYMVLRARRNTDDVFEELIKHGYFNLITSDKERKVYAILTKKYVKDRFDYKHQIAMQILAKLGYEEMIPEAAKFAARGQYDEALEALRYFKSNAAARKLIQQIAAQNNDSFAADRAKKILAENDQACNPGRDAGCCVST